MRKTSWRIAQAVVGAVILFFLVKRFLENWHQVQDQPAVEWNLHWGYIIGSLALTWAMYGVLIWGWRTVLEGWREWIGVLDGARIWTISSLGAYIPGKVWSIAGMAIMARDRGVSAAAATGSAVIMQLLSLATGAMIALALVGAPVFDRLLPGWGMTAAIALGSISFLCAVTLTSPSLTRRIGFELGRPDAVRPVEPGALAGALVANLIAWGGYGLALQLLALGTLRGVELSWTLATGAFAASYITGYLALLAPAGMGVREFVLVAILAPTIGADRALALAVASRLVLTVNQVGAAIPFLLIRSKPRENS